MKTIRVHWTYPYIYSRARGFLSRMLSPSQVEEILRSDITTFLQVLLNTSYKDVVASSSQSEFSIVDFEHAARKELLNRLETLITCIPKDAMRVVNLEFKKFEARNIKQALRILHLVETEGEEVPEELKKFFIPVFYSPEYYERFLDLESIARAIEIIRDARLRKALLEVYEDYKRKGEYSILETKIDTTIYRDLRNVVKYWGVGSNAGDADRFQIYRLVSEEIDLVNTAIVMRCFLAGVDFTDYLIPANFALGDEFCSILAAETVTEVLNILARTPYRHIVERIGSVDERDALHEFELLSKRYIVKRIKSSLYTSPFSVICFYCFLELELQELEDIMTLFVGKFSGLDSEVIKSNLILLGLDGR
ncbi:MAG: V-type ATPase subunit [Candidatus Hodarchaeota archaeon]